MISNNTQSTIALAKKVRLHILNMIYYSSSSHIGSGFSIADILAVLYGKVMQVDPQDPSWENRDRFILSKGHAAAALYSVLAEMGFFPIKQLEQFNHNGTQLSGHVMHYVPGVELSTGALGHGLSVGCGMAQAAKIDDKPYKTYVLLSDGECDEGSIWEAILFAAHHKLDNLIVIVDYNKIQSLGRVDEVLNLEPFVEKWISFGWEVLEVNGHDHHEIQEALFSIQTQTGKPHVIIAHTVKGKGVSFMEDLLAWHYKSPNENEYHQALKLLNEEL